MRLNASARHVAVRLWLSLLAAFLACVQAGPVLPLTLRQNAIDANRPSGNAELAVRLENFGYIELQPNGTLVLRSTAEPNEPQNGSNLLLFRSVWQAIRLTGGGAGGGVRIRVYGDGVEHKFPPFLERIVQRIQSFFSVYKYSDTSRPATAVQPNGATLQTPATSATTVASTTAALALAEGPLEANTFIDIGEGAAIAPVEYAEFVAIGEHDGFIADGQH